MNDFSDPLDGYGDLSEVEQLQAEKDLLEVAYRNSFSIITGEMSFEDILEERGAVIIAHDVVGGPHMWDLENMLYFFEDEEEYEKCVELKDLIYVKTDNARRKQEEDASERLCEVLDNIIRRAEERQGDHPGPPL